MPLQWEVSRGHDCLPGPGDLVAEIRVPLRSHSLGILSHSAFPLAAIKNKRRIETTDSVLEFNWNVLDALQRFLRLGFN